MAPYSPHRCPPWATRAPGAQRPSPTPIPRHRFPVPGNVPGARSFVRIGVSRRSGDAQVARDAESPCRGPGAPSSPVQGEVLLTRARDHPAWPKEWRGRARGSDAGAVGKRAEAGGSSIPSAAQPRRLCGRLRERKRTEIALPPALPIPLSTRLDLSRLLGSPPRPASSAGAHRGLPRKAQRAARVPFEHLCSRGECCRGLPLGWWQEWRSP